MKIPEEVRKTIGYVGYKDQRNGDFVPKGSFFFLGNKPEAGETISRNVYAITARHVIDDLKAKGVTDVALRLNPKAPGATLIGVLVPVEKWFIHPSDNSIDVAIAAIGVPAEADHVVIPTSLCITDEKLREHEIGLGDEVFVSGLFYRYYGNTRNIPIARVGNLAALGEEKIPTKSFGEINGYLIEARSTGGLSGSPVFLNLGSVRSISGQIRHAQGSFGMVFFLLGLIHGHFDESNSAEAAEEDSANSSIKAINEGIAIVVAVKSILAVIEAYERQ